MEDHLKSYLVIESASILAKKNGIPIFVKKKGNLDAGIIFVIIDTLDGEVKLFRRNLNYVIEKNKTFIEYVNLFEDKKVDYSLVEKRIKSEISIDPDCWVVEIEDKNGKNYFEGI